MTRVLQAEVYEASRAIDVIPEDASALEADSAVMKRMPGFLLAMQVVVLFKPFGL